MAVTEKTVWRKSNQQTTKLRRKYKLVNIFEVQDPFNVRIQQNAANNSTDNFIVETDNINSLKIVSSTSMANCILTSKIYNESKLSNELLVHNRKANEKRQLAPETSKNTKIVKNIGSFLVQMPNKLVFILITLSTRINIKDNNPNKLQKYSPNKSKIKLPKLIGSQKVHCKSISKRTNQVTCFNIISTHRNCAWFQTDSPFSSKNRILKYVSRTTKTKFNNKKSLKKTADYFRDVSTDYPTVQAQPLLQDEPAIFKENISARGNRHSSIQDRRDKKPTGDKNVNVYERRNFYKMSTEKKMTRRLCGMIDLQLMNFKQTGTSCAHYNNKVTEIKIENMVYNNREIVSLCENINDLTKHFNCKMLQCVEPISEIDLEPEIIRDPIEIENPRVEIFDLGNGDAASNTAGPEMPKVNWFFFCSSLEFCLIVSVCIPSCIFIMIALYELSYMLNFVMKLNQTEV